MQTPLDNRKLTPLDTRIEDQWRELSKSLTSLRLSRYKLEEDETDDLQAEFTDDNVISLTEKEKSKSAFMLDRIRQEHGRDDGKVN